jgi:hypothetical protein
MARPVGMPDRRPRQRAGVERPCRNRLGRRPLPRGSRVLGIDPATLWRGGSRSELASCKALCATCVATCGALLTEIMIQAGCSLAGSAARILLNGERTEVFMLLLLATTAFAAPLNPWGSATAPGTALINPYVYVYPEATNPILYGTAGLSDRVDVFFGFGELLLVGGAGPGVGSSARWSSSRASSSIRRCRRTSRRSASASRCSRAAVPRCRPKAWGCCPRRCPRE